MQGEAAPLDAENAARLRLVAEDQLARPSERVAARSALRAHREAGARLVLAEVVSETMAIAGL